MSKRLLFVSLLGICFYLSQANCAPVILPLGDATSTDEPKSDTTRTKEHPNDTMLTSDTNPVDKSCLPTKVVSNIKDIPRTEWVLGTYAMRRDLSEFAYFVNANTKEKKLLRTKSTKTGEVLITYPYEFGPFPSVDYSPDGETLYVLDEKIDSEPIQIFLIRRSDGKIIKTFTHILPRRKEIALGKLKVSPDGKSIAVFFSNVDIIRVPGITYAPLVLLNAESGRIIYQVDTKLGFGNVLKFSPDSQRIVTGGKVHTAKIWQTKDGKLLNTLVGRTNDLVKPIDAFSIEDASFHPTKKNIIAITPRLGFAKSIRDVRKNSACQIQIWDLSTSTIKQVIYWPDIPTEEKLQPCIEGASSHPSIEYHPNGDWLLATATNRYVFETDTYKLHKELPIFLPEHLKDFKRKSNNEEYVPNRPFWSMSGSMSAVITTYNISLFSCP